MDYSFYRAAIDLTGGNHCVMMHNIAQPAFFTNNLPGGAFGGAVGFSNAFDIIMLMGVYHILARNKAG